ELDPGAAQGLLLLLEQVARAFDLLDLVDEREHDADVAVGGCTQQRAELRAEEVLEVEAKADRAPAEERVLLGRHLEEERELVSSEVEGANIDGLVREGLRHAPVRVVLLLLPGLGATADDEELRAEEADAQGAVGARGLRLRGEVDVGAQEDRLAVGRDGLEVREEHQLLLPLAGAHIAFAVDALL